MNRPEIDFPMRQIRRMMRNLESAGEGLRPMSSQLQKRLHLQSLKKMHVESYL